MRLGFIKFQMVLVCLCGCNNGKDKEAPVPSGTGASLMLWVDFVAAGGDLKVFTVDGRGTVICAFKQKRKIGRIGKSAEFGDVSNRKITDAQKGAGFFHP